MPLWGNTDAAANSVKYATELTRTGPLGSGNAAKAANNTALYGNNTPNVFGANNAVGQYGVTVAEMANTSGPERPYPQHAGWNMRYAGTGPVTGFGGFPTGTGYSNTDLIKVSGGGVNAAGSLITNSTGGIISGLVTNPGSGFINVASSTIAITNSTGAASAGSGATLTFTLGGRAGRLQYETIIAMGSISSTGNSIPFHT